MTGPCIRFCMKRPKCFRIVRRSCDTSIRPSSAASANTSGSDLPIKPPEHASWKSMAGSRRRRPTTIFRFRSASGWKRGFIRAGVSGCRAPPRSWHRAPDGTAGPLIATDQSQPFPPQGMRRSYFAAPNSRSGNRKPVPKSAPGTNRRSHPATRRRNAIPWHSGSLFLYSKPTEAHKQYPSERLHPLRARNPRCDPPGRRCAYRTLSMLTRMNNAGLRFAISTTCA